MLQRLYIDNYKCLVNFELPLQELSLLLGMNGVGKTAVLDVMFGIRHLLGGAGRVTDPDVFPASTLTRWQDRDLQTVEIEVRLDADVYLYRLEVQHHRATRRARVHREHLSFNGQPLFKCDIGMVQLYRDNHSEGPLYPVDWSESALARVGERDDNQRLTRFRDFMDRVVVCGFYPASFDAVSSDEEALLKRDARNFADWYRHVVLEHPNLVAELNSALAKVIGGFRAIRLERIGQDTRVLTVIFEDKAKDYELRFDEISDGQRVLIALYGLIYLSRAQGYTFFLDEPDNFVALSEIQPWLITLADACGESVTQAVICSHHPELIDYLGSDSGLVLSREASGVVTVRRFDAEPVHGGLKLSELVARGWAR